MDLDARSLERIPHSASTELARPARNRRSRLVPKDPWGKAAIIWATAQLLIIVILESIVAKKHASNNSDLETVLNQNPVAADLIANTRALTVYHVLFIAAQVFQWVLAVDAVYTYSMIELVSTTLFNVALLAYSGLQYKQATDIADKIGATGLVPSGTLDTHSTATLEIIILCAMAVFVTGWVVLSQRLYRVFGWSIFKELGADISVRNRLKLYHIYLMLLKLDVFFFIGFDVQFLALVIMSGRGSVSESEKWIHGLVAIPFTLALLVVAYLAVRRESKLLMTATLLGLAGGIGYLISKLVDVSQNGSTSKYSGSRRSLTFFEGITLALCVATFVFALLTFRNFGKGLKEQLSKTRRGDLELENLQSGQHGPKEAPQYSLE
ncbi:uncharacterized protein EV422DRAFT_204803 [Fimicolochytrium jonesii]|uniref:uncharacterized protein n=1 Tax=Fimicolochytrium jonesii TaxID=1396493 RepID=UPI0022FE9422|nr:uncharacterized protein EV422DRAFT_204803 [Fimicolochytrium jonesii]KAI8817762.1 hypothetical protein EV422DRAFT_204803 [Fimicolochytrium jonesii]